MPVYNNHTVKKPSVAMSLFIFIWNKKPLGIKMSNKFNFVSTFFISLKCVWVIKWWWVKLENNFMCILTKFQWNCFLISRDSIPFDNLLVLSVTNYACNQGFLTCSLNRELLCQIKTLPGQSCNFTGEIINKHISRQN